VVGRGDQQVLLDQVLLDVGRGAEGDDIAAVDDADGVGLLGLLEVVGGEELRWPRSSPVSP
jgi:hypothetical protein